MYGLVVADIGSSKQSTGAVGGKATIFEDRISRRSTGLDYGAYSNEPLSFPIVFTVTHGKRRLDRYELAAISGWLTGHSDFKELVICQPDMDLITYKCRITNLETYDIGMKQVGLTATVTCDGPYAYISMADSVISCGGTTSYFYHNHSNVNDYYRPMIKIECTGTDIMINNQTDGSVFELKGMTSEAELLPLTV